MTPLHDSEKVVGRIRKDGGWDRRYHPVPNPDESSIGELIAGVFVLLLLLWALFWGLPVIFAFMEGRA